MLNIVGSMSTYLQMGVYQWADFKYRQTITHLFYNFIGAPWRRDGTLTCRPHPSREDSLYGLPYGSEPPRVKGSPIPHPPTPTPQPHHPQAYELGIHGRRPPPREVMVNSL